MFEKNSTSDAAVCITALNQNVLAKSNTIKATFPHCIYVIPENQFKNKAGRCPALLTITELCAC
jgi:hypothetical protein